MSPESLSSTSQEIEAKIAMKEAIYDAYVTNKVVSYCICYRYSFYAKC
jgi:hypothetical protein